MASFIKDIGAEYERNDYAIYLPSLQQGYASFARSTPSKNQKFAGNIKPVELDYLNANSKLWHCRYALYSAGLFNKSVISPVNMVSERDQSKTVVIGDSGGYQIGTGALTEMKGWSKFTSKPDQIIELWHTNPQIRARIHRWLETYTDYAMTLDMPLWAKSKKNSPFSQLSTEQLIELSVDNLRYFSDNKGKTHGRTTKLLNVLQDDEQGGGTAWYQAVKDFDCNGWAFGSETKTNFDNTLTWMRRLLDEKKLDNTEWIHILGIGKLDNAVLYTALQRKLSHLVGHKIQISFDSSTPFQLAGKFQKYLLDPALTSDLSTWKLQHKKLLEKYEADPADLHTQIADANSPVMALLKLEDFYTRSGDFVQRTVGSDISPFLVNHNMYAYHAAILRANALNDAAQTGTVTADILKNLAAVEQMFP